jgi:hypothetical protein
MIGLSPLLIVKALLACLAWITADKGSRERLLHPNETTSDAGTITSMLRHRMVAGGLGLAGPRLHS